MTDDELDAIERDYRGISEQREEFCTMCKDGWELWKKEPVQYPGDPYILHFHIAPWDYDYGEGEFAGADPREDIKELLDEVRRLKRELEKDGL